MSVTISKPSKAAVFWSIVMIVGGMLAILAPFAGSIVGDIFVAWLLIVSGVIHLAVAFSNRKLGSFLLKLLLGFVYLIAGIWMLAQPIVGLESLTLFVGVLFFIEGIFEITAYFFVRHMQRAGWLIFDGIVSIVLGGIIVGQWPQSSVWAVGLLIGVNLLVSGIARLLLSTSPGERLEGSPGDTAIPQH